MIWQRQTLGVTQEEVLSTQTRSGSLSKGEGRSQAAIFWLAFTGVIDVIQPTRGLLRHRVFNQKRALSWHTLRPTPAGHRLPGPAGPGIHMDETSATPKLRISPLRRLALLRAPAS